MKNSSLRAAQKITDPSLPFNNLNRLNFLFQQPAIAPAASVPCWLRGIHRSVMGNRFSAARSKGIAALTCALKSLDSPAWKFAAQVFSFFIFGSESLAAANIAFSSIRPR